MKKLWPAVFLVLFALSALADPRDADSVLNRCGKPLKGDFTVLDNSVAGGHRELKYERGILHFDKVAMSGWTFTYGTHKKQDHLDPAEMELFMPCLKDALADTAKPEPLVPITSVQRVEVSAKRDFAYIALWVVLGMAVIGIVLFLMSKRRSEDADEEEES